MHKKNPDGEVLSGPAFRHSGSEHMPSPVVVAVVLNYNGADDTRECVRSLRASGYENLELVIVDNASSDGSADILATTIPDIPLIRMPSNGGYAVGNNAGIRYAIERGAEFILIVNNDVIVREGFLHPMVDVMTRDPVIGAVNGKVFYQSDHENVFSAAGDFRWLLCTGRNRGMSAAARRSATLECDVNYVCGVLLLVRRRVFETLGLLREEYFMYFEDIEFSRRVNTHFRMMYTARAVAYHRAGSGQGWTHYTELYLYYHTRNRLWVFRNDPVLYRFYVAGFTILNALLKSMAVLCNLRDDRRLRLRKLAALYEGVVDGLLHKPQTDAPCLRGSWEKKRRS